MSNRGGSLPGIKTISGPASNRSLQSTIGEARINADLQPLNRKMSKPLDLPSSKIKTRKNMKMSHLKDKRLFDNRRKRSNNLRSFSRSAIPLKPVI